MSWTVFPRIYTNLQSKVCFQFCFQVWRPVISIIADPYMSFYWKWEIITEIFDSWKIQNVNIFYFWKSSPKNGQSFQLFNLYSKGRHFSITKLDILIFCNILHLEVGFWNMSWKRIVKNIINEISEKNGIAYSTTHNLKTAYLWNFHFH